MSKTTRSTAFPAALRGWWGAARAGLALGGSLLLAALVLGVPVTPAQQEAEEEGFYDLDELERLIEVARESGFSEEELRQITIEDNGETINAYEYLRARREREAAAAARERERREKVYLTIQEIVNDLNADRKDELSKLRDESVNMK